MHVFKLIFGGDIGSAKYILGVYEKIYHIHIVLKCPCNEKSLIQF